MGLATLLQWTYFGAGLAGLLAITAVLHRLRYVAAVVLAPIGATIALTAVFQVWAMTEGFPLFAFGIYATLMPAISLVPPIFIVLVALSKRLSPT
jgi:hypothetical protein